MVSLGDFGNEEKQGRQEEILPLTGRRWHDRPVPASSKPPELGGDEFLDVPGTEPRTEHSVAGVPLDHAAWPKTRPNNNTAEGLILLDPFCLHSSRCLLRPSLIVPEGQQK